MGKQAALGKAPVSTGMGTARADHTCGYAPAVRPGLIARLERWVYARMVQFLARRFAWEALVSREPDTPYRVYARLMERVAADMTVRDESFLRDHPLPKRGRLTVIK